MRRTRAALSSGALAVSLTASLTAALPAASAAAPALPDALAAADPTVISRPGYVCGNAELAKVATCGYVIAPLDHAKPTGEKIRLGLAIIPATAPVDDRLGLLVVNAGGPGAPGLTWAATIATLLGPNTAARFDIVGLDPRGVGSSQPRLSCDPNYKKGPRPAYEPTTSASGRLSWSEKAWLKKAKAYAGACGTKYADLLPHMTTQDNARDLDLLRQGFGAPRLSIFGFSYGAYLAQVYATMYPSKVRRLVLDGVPDPRRVWYYAQLEQDRGLEVGIRQFWAWTARHHRTYGLGDTAAEVRARYEKVKAKLRRDPVGRVGSAEWTDVFLEAAYYRRTWPNVAAAFRAWVKGRRAPLTARWDRKAAVGIDTGSVMYLASTCTDAAWPRSYATWRQDAFATVKRAPFETWGNLWDNAPCMFWPVRGARPVKVGTANIPAMLLITGKLDGATPYAGALEVRRRFPTSRLVAETGQTTHTIVGTGNACVNRRLVAYIRDGSLPARAKGSTADVTCPQSPLPKP